MAVCALLGPVAFVAYAATRQEPLPVPTVAPLVVEQPPPASPDYTRWASDIAARTDIPPRALLAYADTEVRLASELPSCGLNWATLAGIASVESDHGRYDNRALAPDGRPSRPIVGVPLNGSPSVAAIPDTDDGILDADPNWDRAVGPLQFIPSTWRTWAADGDANGVTDPQDIDDAALAAGRYLCATGPLSTTDGWRTAVLSYNASEPYVHSVLLATNNYATASHNT